MHFLQLSPKSVPHPGTEFQAEKLLSEDLGWLGVKGKFPYILKI